MFLELFALGGWPGWENNINQFDGPKCVWPYIKCRNANLLKHPKQI